MAAPEKTQSRWGSLLSQAVAGVESRLDTILAETDEGRGQGGASAGVSGAAASASTAATTSTLTSTSTSAGAGAGTGTGAAARQSAQQPARASSRSRVNDRLQARLAQAMAGKASGAGGGVAAGRQTAASSSSLSSSPRSSTDKGGRPSVEGNAVEGQGSALGKKEEDAERPEQQGRAEQAEQADQDETVALAESMDKGSKETESPDILVADTAEAGATAAPQQSRRGATTVEAAVNGRLISQDDGSQPPPWARPSLEDAASTKPDEQSELIQALQEVTDRQQEDIREYIERIDSLESKLQYLSKTATEAAKKAASSAQPGSVEQKLAEKDEKIALLMEEGHKLSSNEQKLRSTTKKLRAAIGENEKQIADLRTQRDRAVSDAEALRARLGGPDDVQRLQEEADRAAAALRKEIDALKRESLRKDDAHRRLDQEWKKKMEQTEASHREALSRALARERQRQKAVEEANAGLVAEREAAAEKARQDEIEWRERLERAHERARKVEDGLKGELGAMEGKLEAMRAAAEEASSGQGGEAQVKMFRQVETLQSQYSSARENWQGIEASLIAKAAGLEKERDEAQRRESEMRKKARDAAVRLRHLEDELHDVQPSLASARQELDVCKDEMAELQASYATCKASLAEAQAEVEKLKQGLAEKQQQQEGHQWAEDEGPGGAGGAAMTMTTSRGRQSRPESPFLPASRSFSSDVLGVGALSGLNKMRRWHAPGSIPDHGSPVDVLSPTRRHTGQTASSCIRTATREPSHAGSGPPPTPFSPFDSLAGEGGGGGYPPVAERENGALETIPSSPRQVAQDMISVSTVAAGPSVQLVERMSAAIRRLEAEKVTAKEEMARVCGQRDEARGHLVALMKEVEVARGDAARVPELEREVARLDARYQTTLEMLGEKSELVEELRADVEDMKAMYRDLVERTVE